MRRELEKAYRATTYEAPSLGLKLRIGETSLPLDVVLRHFGVRDWAFISAANPRSELTDPKTNAHNHQRLRQQMRETGYLFFEGYSIADNRDWPPESSLLILGIDRETAIETGRAYRQNAVVCGSVETPAELVWC